MHASKVWKRHIVAFRSIKALDVFCIIMFVPRKVPNIAFILTPLDNYTGYISIYQSDFNQRFQSIFFVENV